MDFAGGGTGLRVVAASRLTSELAFGVACGGASTLLVVLGGAAGTLLSLLTEHAAKIYCRCVASIRLGKLDTAFE